MRTGATCRMKVALACGAGWKATWQAGTLQAVTRCQYQVGGAMTTCCTACDSAIPAAEERRTSHARSHLHKSDASRPATTQLSW